MASADGGSGKVCESPYQSITERAAAMACSKRELAEQVTLLRMERNLWVSHYEDLLSNDQKGAILNIFGSNMAKSMSKLPSEEIIRGLAIEPINIEPIDPVVDRRDSLAAIDEEEHYIITDPSQELVEERARNAALIGDIKAANLHISIVDAKVQSMLAKLLKDQYQPTCDEPDNTYIVRNLSQIEEAFLEKQAEADKLIADLLQCQAVGKNLEEKLQSQLSLGENLEHQVAELSGWQTTAKLQIQDLDLQLKQSAANLLEFQGLHDTAQQEIKRLTEAISKHEQSKTVGSELEKLLASQKETLEQASASLAEKANKLADIEQELALVTKDRDRLQVAVSDLKQSGTKIDEANHSFQDSVAALREELVHLKQERTTMEEAHTVALNALQTTFDDSIAQFKSAQQKLQESQTEVENLNLILVQKDKLLESEKLQSGELLKIQEQNAQELQNLQERISSQKFDLEKELKELRDRAQQQDAEIKSLKESGANVESTLSVKIKQLQDELENTQKAQADEKTDQSANAVTAATTELQSEVAKLQAALQEKETELTAHKLSATKDADLIQELEQSVKKLTSQNEQMRSAQEKLQQQFDALLESAKSQKDELEAKLQQAQQIGAEKEKEMETMKQSGAETITRLRARVVELEDASKKGEKPEENLRSDGSPKDADATQVRQFPPKLENKLSFDNLTFDRFSPDARSGTSSKYVSTENFGGAKLDQSFGAGHLEDEAEGMGNNVKGGGLKEALDRVSFLKSELAKLQELNKKLEEKLVAAHEQQSNLEIEHKHEILGMKANYGTVLEELRQSRADKAQLLTTISRFENPGKESESRKLQRLQKELETLKAELENTKYRPVTSADSEGLQKQVDQLNEELSECKTRMRRMQGALELESISYSRILDSMREVSKKVKHLQEDPRSTYRDGTGSVSIGEYSANPDSKKNSLNKLEDSQLTFDGSKLEHSEEKSARILFKCREELEIIGSELSETLDTWEKSQSTKYDKLQGLLKESKEVVSKLESELEDKQKEIDRLENLAREASNSKPAEDISTVASMTEEVSRMRTDLASARAKNADLSARCESLESDLAKVTADLTRATQPQVEESGSDKTAVADSGVLSVKLEALEASVKSMESARAELEVQLAAARAQQGLLEERCKQQASELERQRSEHDTLESKLKSLANKEQESADARDQLLKAKEGANEWHILELRARDEDAKRERQQYQDQIGSLKSKLEDALAQKTRDSGKQAEENDLRLQAEISLLKRVHEEQISKLVQEHSQQNADLQSKLVSLANSHEIQLSQIREKYETQLGTMQESKRDLDEVLTKLSAKHATQTKELENSQFSQQEMQKLLEQKSALVNSLEPLQEVVVSLKAEVAGLKSKNSQLEAEVLQHSQKATSSEIAGSNKLADDIQDQIEDLKTLLTEEKKTNLELRKNALSETAKLQAEHRNQILTLEAQKDDQITKLRIDHQSELRKAHRSHQSEVDSLQAKILEVKEQAIKEALSNHRADIDKLAEENEATIEKLKAKHVQELETAKTKWDKEKQLLKKQYLDDLERTEQFCSSLEANVREKERTIIELRSNLNKAQEISVNEVVQPATRTSEDTQVLEYLRSRVRAKDKLIDSIIKEVIAFEDILANDPDKDAPVEIALGILADLKKNMLEQSLLDSKNINSHLESAISSTTKAGKQTAAPSKSEGGENSKQGPKRPNLEPIYEEEDLKEVQDSQQDPESARVPSFGYQVDVHVNKSLEPPQRPDQVSQGHDSVSGSGSRGGSPEKTIRQLKEEIVALNQKIASMASHSHRGTSKDSVEEERTLKPVASLKSGNGVRQSPYGSKANLQTPGPNTNYSSQQQSGPRPTSGLLSRQTPKGPTPTHDELENKLIRLKTDLVKGQEKMKQALAKLEEKDQLIEHSALEIQSLKRTIRELKISEKMMQKELSNEQRGSSPRSTSKSSSPTPARSPTGARAAAKGSTSGLSAVGSTKKFPVLTEPSPKGLRPVASSRSPLSKPPAERRAAADRSVSREKPSANGRTPQRTTRPQTSAFQTQVSRGTTTEEGQTSTAQVVSESGGYLTLSAAPTRDSAPLALFAANEALKGIHLRLVEITSRNSLDQLKQFSIEGQSALGLLRDLSKKIQELLGISRDDKESGKLTAQANGITISANSAEAGKSALPKPTQNHDLLSGLEELTRIVTAAEDLAQSYSQLDDCAVVLAKSLTAKQKVASVTKIKEFIKSSECDRFKFRCELLSKEDKKVRQDKLRPLIKQSLDSLKQQFELVKNTYNDRKGKLANIAQTAGENLDLIIQSLSSK